MKYSEALVQRGTDEMRIIKGAPSTIVTFVGVTTFPEAEKLAGDGYRVWAVAAGSERHLTTVGFLALLDPPRDDSGRLVANLQHLGVRV